MMVGGVGDLDLSDRFNAKKSTAVETVLQVINRLLLAP